MNKLEIKLTFSLDTYHIFADRLSFGIDKAICLDYLGDKLLIPATSLKGIIRHNVENVLRSRGIKVCLPPRPDKTCGNCIVCKFFGSPKNKSPLIFEDAIANSSSKGEQVSVSIERRRKTAKKDRLFSMEIGFDSTFSAKIRGLLSSRDDALLACALVYIGVKSGFALGSGKSRGLGWTSLKEFKATINGLVVPLEDIKNKIEEVLK